MMMIYDDYAALIMIWKIVMFKVTAKIVIVMAIKLTDCYPACLS